QKAVNAGYISGYSDHTFRPNNPITHDEAATIIAKLLHLQDNVEGVNALKDAASIPAWSKGAVGAVVAKQIMA
ncbi:MAG: S-layer homology domain-containing protein, partial [Cohnella sp.]|nr:S-layer homology domain-containing protein [Cohnella sp.]